MTKYNHQTPRTAEMRQRKAQFVHYCATHISEWKSGFIAIANYRRWKMKQAFWREHYKGLSDNCWSVCTYADWLAKRKQLGVNSMTYNYLRNAGRYEWPEHETAIDNTGRNGECDAPIYHYNCLDWRINPVGLYALYLHKGAWRESQQTTNAVVRLNGVLQK